MAFPSSTTPSVATYLSLLSSRVAADSEVKKHIDEYVAAHPLSSKNSTAHINNLKSFIANLQDSDDFSIDKHWLARAEFFLSAGVPELAAIDAYRAYICSGGENGLSDDFAAFYHSEDNAWDDKIKTTVILSYALLFAGCYNEAWTVQRDNYGDHNDETEAIRDVASQCLDTAMHRNHTYFYLEADYETVLLTEPRARDGKIVATRYPTIPLYLLDLRPTIVSQLDTRLQAISRGTCEMNARMANVTIDGQNVTSPVHSIYATQDIAEGTTLFHECTDHCAAIEPWKFDSCMHCLRAVKTAAGEFLDDNRIRLCNATCAQHWRREIHIPGDLLQQFIEAALEYQEAGVPGEIRHPLDTPHIARLTANYGGTVHFSHDDHVAMPLDGPLSAVAHTTNGLWDGAVLMNILARVQNCARVFVAGVDGNEYEGGITIVAVTRYVSLIKVGTAATANVKVLWDGDERGAIASIVAIATIKKGAALVVAA